MSQVFRVERNKNFTVMANYHLKDKRLSLKAKRLLSVMLSLPNDWNYNMKGLELQRIPSRQDVLRIYQNKKRTC